VITDATFSITARCPASGRLGIAVATCGLAVGGRVPHVRSMVGAVATQARLNPYLGFEGMAMLAAGAPAADTATSLCAWDPDIEHRQLAIVDGVGNVAAHTGRLALPYAGHLIGDGVAVAGNQLASHHVLEAMLETFEASAAHAFATRLLHALDAGDRAGGDARGKQSAALCVVGHERLAEVDLRVDHHPDPLRELHRLYDVYVHHLLPHIDARPRRTDFDLSPAEAWRRANGG